jgi:hypothetical protein
MPRPVSLEYAAQLEARARDIRAAQKHKSRAADTRAKVLLGALALSYASSGPGGVRLLEAFARLPALKPRDAAFLASSLPPSLASAFASLTPSKEAPNV